MKRKLLILFGLILFLVSFSLADDAWLADGSTRRQKITTQVANIDGDLTWFPLYVYIDPSATPGGATMTEAANDGTDIRFTTSDGQTLLAYERCYWNGGGGGAVTAHFFVSKTGWVIDADGAPAATYIYVYYGGGGADGQNITAVWDGDFMAVWHLDEAGNPYLDATSNNNDSSAGTYPDQVNGKIYKGQDFNGTDDYIDVDNAASLQKVDDDNDWTISLWLNSDDATAQSYFLFKGSDWSLDVGDGNNDFRFQERSGFSMSITTDNPIAANSTWYYAVIKAPAGDLTDIDYFVNAVARADNADVAGYDGTGSDLYIGRNAAATWAGLLDEIRISDIERSDAWGKFEYYNMNEADNELTWAAEESEPAGDSFIPKVIIMQ